jgi:hypothetical protein
MNKKPNYFARKMLVLELRHRQRTNVLRTDSESKHNSKRLRHIERLLNT